MPVIDPVKIGEEACICGRSAIRKHCPFCGLSKHYGFSKKISRPHPISGEIITDIIVFRCQGCGKHFDDLQWRFECKAPKIVTIQSKIKLEQSKEAVMDRARRNEKFDTNDKRHFKRVVGIHYEDFMQMHRNMEALRVKSEFAKRGIDSTNIESSPVTLEDGKPSFTIKDGKPVFKIPGLE